MRSPTKGRVTDLTSRAHLGPYIIIKAPGLEMHSDAYGDPLGSFKSLGQTFHHSDKHQHSDGRKLGRRGSCNVRVT